MIQLSFLLSDLGNEEWEEVEPRGGKQHDIRLVGHSMIYHPESHSLIVYGGILADAARFSKLSDRLFIFNLEELHWTELLYPRGTLPDLHIPLERAFHAAVLMGSYMVVFGGYTHKHNREEICYDSGIINLAYDRFNYLLAILSISIRAVLLSPRLPYLGQPSCSGSWN